MHSRSLPDPDVLAADGTEELHGSYHLCLLYRWLQEAHPGKHPPEEGFSHMQHQESHSAL